MMPDLQRQLNLRDRLLSTGRSVLLAVGVVAVVALYLAYPNAVPDFRSDQEHDAFEYILLARSLLDGHGYPTKHWNPGFPMLLAGGLWVWGLNWLSLKLAMVGIAFATLALAQRLFQNLLDDPWVAAVLALLLAVVPVYFDYAHRLMSEIPFVFCVLLALVALTEVEKMGHAPTRRQWGWVVVLMMAAPLAVLVRGNALALAPALLLGAWPWRKGASTAMRHACCAALVLLALTYGLWTARNVAVTYRGIHNITYLEEMQAKDIVALWRAGGFTEGVEKASASDLIVRVLQNGRSMLHPTASLIVPGILSLDEAGLTRAATVLAVIVGLPVVVGYWLLRRRSIGVWLYLTVAISLNLLYPTGGGGRMLLPFLPVLIVIAYLGVARLMGQPAAQGWAVTVLAVSFVGTWLFAQQQARQPYSYAAFADFVAAVEQAPELARSAEPILSPHHTVVLALTGLPVVGPEDIEPVLSSDPLGSILVINAVRDSRPLLTLPSGLKNTVLLQRGEVVISRLSR